MKHLFLAMALVPLAGCIFDPTNRTNQESTTAIAVDGYASSGSAPITLTAKNQDNGVQQTIGSATSNPSPSFTTPYNMHYWSTSITPAANFWSPQWVMVNGVNRQLNGLPASAGRLEFTATTGGSAPFSTFSASAKSCFWTHMGNGESAFDSGYACADGTSITVFDNNGVGNGAPATGWVTDYVGSGAPPGVAWEIGHYAVQSQNIYGVICRPTSAGTHKAVIINHGGYGPIDQGVINTYCIGSAQAGWVTAMSAYRGEQVVLPTGLIYTSGGNVELCQGEVTDVLRLTELVRARADVDTTKILMWGHSHGGCITERAVQRGAQVKAAAIFSAPNDMAAWYNYIDAGTQAQLALTFGIPSMPLSVTPAQSPIPYDWRSPAKYKKDLEARSDVKLLMLQGVLDTMIKPSQACTLATGGNSLNWHFNLALSPVALSPQPGSDCDSLTWQSVAPPVGSWPAPRYLLVYDYGTHDTIITGAAWAAFVDWVATIFP